MASSVARQIIGSFEDIGKDVAGEIAKVPTDIAGKALESFGTSAGKPGQQTAASPPPGETKQVAPAFEEFGKSKSAQAKKKIARAALEELAGGAVKAPKEPSIWEKIQMEAEQKKQQKSEQQAVDDMQLVMPKGKRKRGDLYGAHAKATATENRSTRQD